MSLVLDQPHLVDTLRYRLQVQKSLPQDTVRIAVVVLAMVRSADRDAAALELRIREALGAFIAADWMLTRIERTAEAAGYERVQLVALTRVPAASNYDLDERARRASREGLRLGPCRVDYGLSTEKVNEVVEELRIEILRLVRMQLPRIAAETGRDWRIGDVEFGASDARAATSKGAFRDTSDVGQLLESLDGEDLRGLQGAERISLIANVTLKAAGA